MCNKNQSRQTTCWNEMEELKHLICAIDCWYVTMKFYNNFPSIIMIIFSKCPRVSPPPSCSIMLPPRIVEVPCIVPPQRPVCRPPKPCCPPIYPGPCCPCPLPRPPPQRCPPRPPARPLCCPPCSPLPCYPSILIRTIFLIMINSAVLKGLTVL